MSAAANQTAPTAGQAPSLAQDLARTKSRDGFYRVVVYGTLKTGRGNNRHFMKSATLVGPVHLLGDYCMRDLTGFPAVHRCASLEEATPVKGELWEVTRAEMLELDRLEGHPDFYTRVVVDTPYGPSWMYIILQPSDYVVRGDNRVASGLWRPLPGEEAAFAAVPAHDIKLGVARK